MTQSIVIQVGQCGNQIGCRFWDLCLREHAHHNPSGDYDQSISSFFRNTESRRDHVIDIPTSRGVKKVKNLKARAILVDMEEGVVGELLQGHLKDVFDPAQLITDVSGSGNNWAEGNLVYGSRYRDAILEKIRISVEACDCLQSFFLLHSIGGGTGSGLGTFILSLLQDFYPDVHRFVCCVNPSRDDDVITSPYNSVLAMKELTEFADCVMPINNMSLNAMCEKLYDKNSRHRGFEQMNNIVANVILNMTSSSRFEGSLNVNLNEFAMNLVPFPRLHYLISSISPLVFSKDLKIPPRRLNHAFDDLFRKDHQLVDVEMRSGVFLACTLMARGEGVQMSDIRNNISRLKSNLEFVRWNEEGWKTGLCNYAPTSAPYSLLALSNNSNIRKSFLEMKSSFNRLYNRKAHIHHYLKVDGFDQDIFSESLTSLDDLVKEYKEVEDLSRSNQGFSPIMKVL